MWIMIGCKLRPWNFFWSATLSHSDSRLLWVFVWKSLGASCVLVKVCLSFFSLTWPFWRPFSATENDLFNIRIMMQLVFIAVTSSYVDMWAPASSNYLNISSVWKSVVASCVCVAEVWTHVFDTFISSTKVFVSSTKRVHYQQLKCSSVC